MENRHHETIRILLVLLCTAVCTAAIIGTWAAGQTAQRDAVLRYFPAADGASAVQRIELPEGRIVRRSVNTDATSAAAALEFDELTTLSAIGALRLPDADEANLAALLAAPAARVTYVDSEGGIFTRTETLSLFDGDTAFVVRQSFADFSVVFVPALPTVRVDAVAGVTETVTGTVAFLPGNNETVYTATLTLRERTTFSSTLGSFDDCLVVHTGLRIGTTDLSDSLRTICAGVGEVASEVSDPTGRVVERSTTLLAAAPGRLISAETLPASTSSSAPPPTTSPPSSGWTYTHTQRTASIFAAPQAADGLVFVGNYHGEMLALDAGNGARAWRFQSGGPIFGAAAHADGRIVFGSADRRVYALDAATGALLWIHPLPDAVIAGPTIHADIAYVGDESGRLVALDVADGRLLASFETNGAVAFPPAATNEAIYVASESGALFALEPRTLVPRWAFAASLPLSSPPLVADDAVYFTSHDESVYAVARHPNGDRGEELWKASLRTTSQGALQLSRGSLLVTSSDRITALDVESGMLRWTTERASLSGNAVLVGDCAVVEADGALVAYALADGRRLAALPTGFNSRSGSVGLDENYFFIGASAGDVYALPRTALSCAADLTAISP